MIWAEFQTDI